MSTVTALELDPLEEHLLAALRALEPSAVAARRAARGRGDLARPGRQPAGGLRGALAPAARAELLHDRLGRSRVERRGRARAARRRPGAPPLPLGRVLPRPRRAGRDRRAARHHARRRRRRGRADRGRAAQGLRPEGARRPPDDVDDRVAPAARGRDGARDRPRRAPAGVEPLARRRGRPAARSATRRSTTPPRRRRSTRPRRSRTRVFRCRCSSCARTTVSGSACRARRLGRVRADRARADALRDRVRARPRRGARRRERARRLGARAATAGRPPSAHRCAT